MTFLSILPRLSSLHRLPWPSHRLPLSLHRLSCPTSINSAVRRCSIVPQTFEANNSNNSLRFPDYKVIFEHRAIGLYAMSHSIRKYHAVASVIFCLLSLSGVAHGILPLTTFSEALAACVITGLVLHLNPFTPFHPIVYVYNKEEDKTAIITYISHLGKRVDLKVQLEKIPITSRPSTNLITRQKRYIITSPELKPFPRMLLYQQRGIIYDQKTLKRIFNME